MPAVLFDTSVYINILRQKIDDFTPLKSLASGQTVWMSAVVLEELHAGATGENRKTVQGLEDDFRHSRRILVPNQEDWIDTGKVLARLAAKYHYEQIGRGRLTNDALIAVSASRTKATVITINGRDFSRLAEFRRFEWRPI